MRCGANDRAWRLHVNVFTVSMHSLQRSSTLSFMLPLALLALIQVQIVYGQQAVPLTLDGVYNYNSSSKSPSFSLPASSNLSVSVALCADATSPPRFFVTNDSTITHPSQQYLGVSDVYEITLEDGYGEWNGIMDNGGYLAVSNAQVPFEIGASDQGEHDI